MKAILFCFAFLLALSYVDAKNTYNLLNGSVIITDANINQARLDFGHLLVNFDAGCRWCLQFRTFYNMARKSAAAAGLKVTFGWMDLKKNPLTKAKYNITRHPTQMLFIRKYPKSPLTYGGVKNAKDLLAWLNVQLPAIQRLGY